MTATRIAVSGADLYVQTAGDGPPLLLVHGFPLDHSMWSGQLASLPAVRLIAPDLRGFGQSTGEVGEMLTMKRLADDLAEMLDALQVNQPITLCGLSMGGYIALEFWHRHPQRLSRLILCDTKAAGDTPPTAKGRQLAAQEVLSEGTAALSQSMIPKLFADTSARQLPEIVDRTARIMADTNPQVVAAALRGMAQRTDFTHRLAEFDLPILVICGSDDVITPAKEMREMAAALPRASYVEIAQAGHLAPLERPAEVNQAIERFLLADPC